MAKKKQIKKPPPLIPHMTWGDFGRGVAVVRIPSGTKHSTAQETIKKLWQLARTHSGGW